MGNVKELENVTVIKDFGMIGEEKWKYHLTLCSWFGRDPKYDLIVWNDDMTKYGKGVTLSLEELSGLGDLINEVLEEE